MLFIFLKNDIFDSLPSKIFDIIISELLIIYFDSAFICSLLNGNLKLSINDKNKDLFKSSFSKFLIFIFKILSYGDFL